MNKKMLAVSLMLGFLQSSSAGCFATSDKESDEKIYNSTESCDSLGISNLITCSKWKNFGLGVSVGVSIGAIFCEIGRSIYNYCSRLKEKPVTVILFGSPSTGKSTLVNTATGSNFKTGEAYGVTTKLSNVVTYVNGKPVVFYDTPGLHKGAKGDELIGIENAKKVLPTADVVVVTLRSFSKKDGEEIHAKNSCNSSDKSCIAVTNEFEAKKYAETVLTNQETTEIMNIVKAAKTLNPKMKVIFQVARVDSHDLNENNRKTLIKGFEGALAKYCTDLNCIGGIKHYINTKKEDANQFLQQDIWAEK